MLSDTITCLNFQSSTVLTKMASIESKLMGMNTRVTDLREELQRSTERHQGRTRIEAGIFPSADLQDTFRSTICDTLQRNEDVQGNFHAEDLRRRQGDKLPLSVGLPVHRPSNPKATSRDEQGNPGIRLLDKGKTSLPILHNNKRTPSFRRRIVRSTYGEYNLVFATVSWRFRVIQMYHEGVNLNGTEITNLKQLFQYDRLLGFRHVASTFSSREVFVAGHRVVGNTG